MADNDDSRLLIGGLHIPSLVDDSIKQVVSATLAFTLSLSVSISILSIVDTCDADLPILANMSLESFESWV